ncbi:MAG: hypothetical protein NT179_00855 [Nitrospirae bacterium]|nr:hypothetical protein [Nitrospirota bacterium]
MKSSVTPTNLLRQVLHSLLGIAALTLVSTGCAGGARTAPHATVSVHVEEVTDWSFETSHPVVIDQPTIGKVLLGLYRMDGQSRSSKTPASGSKPLTVFSDEETALLAPLLAKSLSQATPNQLVGFRLTPLPESGAESIRGSLYVQHGSIYLTIGKGSKPTGFLPKSAVRTEPAPAYVAGGTLDATTMIIDYQALAKAEAEQPAPTKAASLAKAQETGEGALTQQQLDELSNANQELARKNIEVTMLRRESDWMKRELRERDEEIKAIKRTAALPTVIPPQPVAQAIVAPTKPALQTKVSDKPAQKKKQAKVTKTH